MASKKVYTVPFRRKKEGKTNYQKRLAILKSASLRMVVRKSNKHMVAQIVKYGDQGDMVEFSAHTQELESYGWKHNTGNIPSAYLLGFLLGSKAKGKSAILDLGLQTPMKGARLFSVLKGAIDAGLKVPCSEEVFPEEERLHGAHIDDKIKADFLKVKENITAGKGKK